MRMKKKRRSTSIHIRTKMDTIGKREKSVVYVVLSVTHKNVVSMLKPILDNN